MRRFILMVAAVVLCVSTAIAQVSVERPYAVGADISWLQAQEDHGVVFSDGDNSILGSINDPNSVAYFLQIIFNWIKLIGPFIVIVMSGIDFAKVVVMGDDDGMKKAQNKLIIRLILAASLFFLPDLIGALLDLFNITSSGICGLQ